MARAPKIGSVHRPLIARAERADHYLLHYGKLTLTVYTHVKDSDELLTLRYLCIPQDRRNSAQEIWETILRMFAQHPDIDFAYPTQCFYNNRLEGPQTFDPMESE